MYRGNAPGQFNGNRLPANKEYNAAYGMPGPGQGQLRGSALQGHNVPVQRFSNQSYSGAPSQMQQFRSPQGGGASYADPYAYNQRKMSSDSQHSLPGANQSYGGMSTGDMFGGAQNRPPASYATGGTSEFPMVQDNSMAMQQYQQGKVVPPGWNKPGTDTNAMMYASRTPSGNKSFVFWFVDMIRS